MFEVFSDMFCDLPLTSLLWGSKCKMDVGIWVQWHHMEQKHWLHPVNQKSRKACAHHKRHVGIVPMGM